MIVDESRPAVDAFCDLIRDAAFRAQEVKEAVFLADDENGKWSLYLSDEEGYAAAILLVVNPDGTFRLVDNTVAGNSEEPWRR